MRRRLPIYFVMDLSTSMGISGADILLHKSLTKTFSSMLTDPMAIETIYASMIGYHDEAFVISELKSVTDITVPPLTVGGLTSTGAALSLLAKRMLIDITPNTPTSRGDWRPIAFVLTDGMCTDSLRNGVADITRADTGLIYACGIGNKVSIDELKTITDNVILLNDGQSLDHLFEWISHSISINSLSLNKGTEYKDDLHAVDDFQGLVCA